eukprot:Phypoly_transcript_06031.p1 GENE.Phypoly_transcript_06031~~Phypoly_transcript_06031.p1  ORF type:complete len:569 (+),score=78.70 Phypoly_transcript_06031:137-1843(+)
MPQLPQVMLQEIEDPQQEEKGEKDDPLPPIPPQPPFPYKKVFIGAMIWFMDWFNGGSLGSFVGYMVLDFGLVTTPADVGYYSGFLSSTYFFSQFISSFWWGKLSDKKGRRPILLCGLIGSLISTVAFGFSTNFAMAIVARSLNGLLNSNSGVVKTYIGEITDSSNQARAFGYLSLVGGLGMVVGPMIGGYFAKPVEKYPQIFPTGSLFDHFPYLLPSLVSAVLNVILFILAYVYLSETRKTNYVGLNQAEEEMVDASGFSINGEEDDETEENGKNGEHGENGESGENGDATITVKSGKGKGYEKVVLISESDKISDEHSFMEGKEKQSAFRKWISDRVAKLGMFKDPGVLLTTGLYGFYGFTSGVFGEVLPIFAMLPIEKGGMGFGTGNIGNLATIAGVTIILFNLLFYSKICNKIGLIKTFQVGTFGLVLLHTLVAEIPRWTINDHNEPEEFVSPTFKFWAAMAVTLCLFWSCRQMQLTTVMQLISNSCTPKDMGAVNGLGQSIVALTRMFAPTFGSNMLAWSVSINSYFILTSRFVFILLSILSFIMVSVTLKLDPSLNKPKLWTG